MDLDPKMSHEIMEINENPMENHENLRNFDCNLPRPSPNPPEVCPMYCTLLASLRKDYGQAFSATARCSGRYATLMSGTEVCLEINENQ